MGFHPENMIRSDKLRQIIAEYQSQGQSEYLGGHVDMTSTGIGPELVDNGIGLAFAALRYTVGLSLTAYPEAKIFFAFGDDACYYQYGRDEDDAIARLRQSLSGSRGRGRTFCARRYRREQRERQRSHSVAR